MKGAVKNMWGVNIHIPLDHEQVRGRRRLGSGGANEERSKGKEKKKVKKEKKEGGEGNFKTPLHRRKSRTWSQYFPQKKENGKMLMKKTKALLLKRKKTKKRWGKGKK